MADEDEIKNLFNFLGSEKPGTITEKIKFKQLIFGIDNLLYGISDAVKDKIKRELQLCTREEFVSYEDFKIQWKANFNLDYGYYIKESSSQMHNLLSDILDKGKKVDKITAKDLEKIILELKIQYYDKEEESNKIKSIEKNKQEAALKERLSINNFKVNEEVLKTELNKWREDKLKSLSEELIECIDLDLDGCINKADLEFLMTEYMLELKK